MPSLMFRPTAKELEHVNTNPNIERSRPIASPSGKLFQNIISDMITTIEHIELELQSREEAATLLPKR